MFKRLLKRKPARTPPVNRWYMFLNEIVKYKAKKAAQSLSKKSGKLSPKQLIYCLYAFSATGILLNALIIIAAFKARSPTPILTHNVQKREIPTTASQAHSSFSIRDYNRVIQIEAFLDSLQQSETGRKQYDSFIQQRPKFRDSIALYKKRYEHP